MNGADVIASRIDAGTGRRAVVIGGGVAGAELAHRLVLEGNDVTVLEMLPDICNGGELFHTTRLKDYLDRHATVLTSVAVKRISADAVEYADAEGARHTIPADLGDVSAAAYALIERLVFQNLTYQKEPRAYREARGRCLFIVTSNSDEASYEGLGFNAGMLRSRKTMLEHTIGATHTFVSGLTQQVADYGRYSWDMFDGDAQIRRREEVFPTEREEVRQLGARLASGDWK